MLVANSRPERNGSCVRGRRCDSFVGVESNVIFYNSLITSCTNAGVNVISYSSLITACAKAGKAKEAFGVSMFMHAGGVEPNVISYNALITACTNGGLNVISYSLLVTARAKT